ncbi:hypothetical protein [Klebsiella pneumoniae]|uniref:hypothetical protein n=1 Tax=Klebsiella pneumoniae TaxID=573 RepID=UPI00396F3543
MTASSNMLTLKDREESVWISAVDSQWTLFRTNKLPVAEGERLAVLGKIPDTRLKGGESVTVLKAEAGQLTVQRPGQKTTQTLPVGSSPFDEAGGIHSVGPRLGASRRVPAGSVSETATVFASVTQRELDNATLNQLAQSGAISGCTAQDAARTTEKLARHTAFSVVSEQLKVRSGEADRGGHRTAESRTAYPGRAGDSPFRAAGEQQPDLYPPAVAGHGAGNRRRQSPDEGHRGNHSGAD